MQLTQAGEEIVATIAPLFFGVVIGLIGIVFVLVH